MPKISVIIPVYNAEKYLNECLDSVINQTLTDIEIICINDGSTDNSLMLLQEYKKKDNRIILIDKKNQGVGKTRNLGILKAHGEFVVFMDPDDVYPENDILLTLYNKAKENNVLICGGEFSSYDNGKFTQNYKGCFLGYLFKENGIIDYKDYQFDYGYHRFIYNRKFLIENNIFYPFYKRYQDPPFFAEAMAKAGKFYALNKITYGYRRGHKKIIWTKDKILDNLKGIKDVILIAKKYHLKELQKLESKRLLYEYLPRFNNNFSILSYLEIFKLCILDKNIAQYFINLTIKPILKTIFSLTNSTGKTHKILTVLGVKIKIRIT